MPSIVPTIDFKTEMKDMYLKKLEELKSIRKTLDLGIANIEDELKRLES